MPGIATVYLDTSVINHLFADDTPDLKGHTIDFFNKYINTGIYKCFVSNVVIEEINKTQNETKREQLLTVLDSYPMLYADLSNIDEITKLADLYISNKVIPAKKREDALHIAITVVNKFDYLVSWNFQHLANVNRERKVIAINQLNNYLHPLRIIPPILLMEANN